MLGGGFKTKIQVEIIKVKKQPHLKGKNKPNI